MINSKKRFCERLPNVKSCCIGVNFISTGVWESDLLGSYRDLTSFIKQGTGRHERIGDKIKLLKAHVRIYYKFEQIYIFPPRYPYCSIRHGLVKTKFYQEISYNSSTYQSSFLRSSDFGTVSYMEAYYDDAKVEVFKDSLCTLYKDSTTTHHAYKVYDYVKDINEIICYFDNDKPSRQLVLSDFYDYDRDNPRYPPRVLRIGNITLYFIDV